jgi:glutamate--cysteine ligase
LLDTSTTHSFTCRAHFCPRGPAISHAVTPSARELEALVRERFPSGARALARIGIELETLPVRDATRTPVLPLDGADGPGTLGVLRHLAGARGWLETPTGYGPPKFLLEDGGVISYEPGGQLEWSSSVHDSLESLDAAAHDVCHRLADAMLASGIRLLARGVDPVTRVGGATMVVHGVRYRRQRTHYDRIGTSGRAMMLQTAGVHLNLDVGDDPVAAWSVANTLAPLLVAMFANSPERAGRPEPHRSHRAAIWRTLDPTRTAVFAPAADPVQAYLAFALAADSFLLGEPGAAPRRFDEWRAMGATDDDFARHLTTLFPEVRPRGAYLELRSVDALPVRWAVLPIAVVWAAFHHAPLRRDVLRQLPAPTEERLVRAARDGLADDELGSEARWLAARVPGALDARLEHGRSLVARLEEFFDAFTQRGRDPGDRTESNLAP